MGKGDRQPRISPRSQTLNASLRSTSEMSSNATHYNDEEIELMETLERPHSQGDLQLLDYDGDDHEGIAGRSRSPQRNRNSRNRNNRAHNHSHSHSHTDTDAMRDGRSDSDSDSDNEEGGREDGEGSQSGDDVLVVDDCPSSDPSSKRGKEKRRSEGPSKIRSKVRGLFSRIRSKSASNSK